MAAIDIYVDCDLNRVVTSPTDSSPKQLPKFFQGATIKLRIWLLKGFKKLSAYEQIPTAGITLEVGVGPDPVVADEDPRDYLTQQFTWDPSDDEAQPYFEGTLSFATAAINELLGSSNKATATFEIVRTEEGYPNPVLQQQITVYAGVIQENGLTEPLEATPMSVEVANATYIPFAGFQGTLRLISPDGTKAIDIYCGDDGALHTDSVTL